jgi:hypothetical protein
MNSKAFPASISLCVHWIDVAIKSQLYLSIRQKSYNHCRHFRGTFQRNH